jgi:hypothetical protein
MSAWFVDDPLWAYVVCGFVALVLLVMFFTSKRVKFVVWIAVPLFIALGFYLLDRYVETDREQVVRKTHELAAAAQRGLREQGPGPGRRSRIPAGEPGTARRVLGS